MFLSRSPLLLPLLLAGAPLAAQESRDPIAVYLLVGQSNMQGKGKIEHLRELAMRELEAGSDGERDGAPGPIAHDWQQWRGPLGTGEAPGADPPVSWSEEENVRWKTGVLGRGHSSPIVTGDRVIVTTAIPFGDTLPPSGDDAPGAHDNTPITQRHEFVVRAFDRRDGSPLWSTTVRRELPHAGAHESGTLASASPVTDGEFVYAFFGSYGMFALDMDGEISWEVDLGDMQVKHGHGEGSSPALHGDTLVVNWDHEGQSFVVALDKRTGEERWRAERDEVTSWSSPIIVVDETVEGGGRPQAIVAGTQRIRGYDLATGAILWEAGGLSNNVCATPVARDGIVYVGSSYEKRAMFAIRYAGAEGDLTDTDRVLWSRHNRTPYVPSPVLSGDAIYWLNHYQGVLMRVIAATGEEPSGPFRLDGIHQAYASPVSAAGRIYVTDRDGTTLVISDDEEPTVLGLNRLDEPISASFAIVGRELFIRGENALYCIAED